MLRLPSKPHIGLLEATHSLLTNIAARTMIPYAALIHKANKNPDKIPTALDSGIRLMHDEAFIARSHKVGYQGMEYLALKGYGSEFAYDASNHDWLTIADAAFKKVQSLAHDKGIHGASPFMFRFTNAGRAYLGQDFGRKTMWFSNPALLETLQRAPYLGVLQDFHLLQGGRPHWGKMTNRAAMNPLGLLKHYPKVNVWRNEMRKLNPHDTFSNAFTDRFRLTRT